MKNFVGGLLIAATMLTPLASASAQTQGERGNRAEQSRGGNGPQGMERQRGNPRADGWRSEGRRPDVQRPDAQSRPDQRRFEDRRTDQRRDGDFRRDDPRRHDPRYQDRGGYDRRDQDRGRDWNRGGNASRDRDWNRDWRNDRRYNWRDYRSSNRNAYRMPRYVSPHRGYGYSRFNIGMNLGPQYYSNRYWINNPGAYRLPPAYGNYRWVRYYDDALLIDVRRGRVIDVMYDFFW